MSSRFLVTCEHASNFVPKKIQDQIKIPKKVLDSHRGYDLGAKNIARKLSKLLSCHLIEAEYSRLLIELNRSLHHPKLWSEYSKVLSKQEKNHWLAYYDEYEKKVLRSLQKGMIHFSVHSFTPVLGSEKRNCDFAVLYDPKRKKEKEIALKIKESLQGSGIKCRLNYPYRGSADGLTTKLRKKLGLGYVGLELEFNQAMVDKNNQVDDILDRIKSSKD